MKTLPKDVTGIVPIYKPVGPTSHDMVYKVRKHTGIKKVGHAGTLDPLAEGVLVMGITREGTKQLTALVKKEKEYLATVKFGETSTTDDAEGEKSSHHSELDSESKPSLAIIKKILPSFTGDIWQTPPIYSAIKVKGQEAYKRVRKGEIVKLEPRLREVKEIEVLEYSWPILKLRIVTGSGVYIRSIARDLGDKLKVGGYLAGLTRTRVDHFLIENCLQVPAF